MNVIAHIETPFREKFGVPRQAGLVDYEARIVFEPEYRVAEAVRGLEDFEYIWLIWQFHLAEREEWSPTVRPPRLGGNHRVGVFATRSPFRPNSIGLSSVRLLRIEPGPVLVVSGADLVDGTPILDIKPYIPYADSHPDASAGFAQHAPSPLKVDIPQHLLDIIAPQHMQAVTETLAGDPRPHYHNDQNRLYAVCFTPYELHFRVVGDTVKVEKVVLNKVKTATKHHS